MNKRLKIFSSAMLALVTMASLFGFQNCSAQPSRAQLEIGKPSEAEITEIQRIKLPPHYSPRKAIGEYVDGIATTAAQPVVQRASLKFLDHPALYKSFSDCIFYSLRFPQWPVSFAVPAPLRSNNIFLIDRSAKLVLITANNELEKAVRERLHGIKDEQSARLATIAYLFLVEEMAQDGMYHFTIPESEIKVQCTEAGITASGRAFVEPASGNKGDVVTNLVFSPHGDVLSAQAVVNLRAGMRPICQSTKLLDPDPIVRRMAEQDLLIMGSSAKPYLDEQRKKVSPQLQTAIDKIWQRIQLEGR